MSIDSVMRKSTFDTSDCQLIDDYWQPVNVIKKGTHAIILIVNHITTAEKKPDKVLFCNTWDLPGVYFAFNVLWLL